MTENPNLTHQAEEISVNTNDQVSSKLEQALLGAKAGLEGTEKEPDAGLTSEESHILKITIGSQEYVCTFSKDQWKRMATIIPPKPKPTELDRAQITADHIQAVVMVWQLLFNRINDCIVEHDSRKLKQTEDEHHKMEPHHWPLDGYDTSDGYLPLQYVAEAVCDYMATMFGRAFAGREFGYLPPTNQITAADVLGATCVDLLIAYDLATVDPAPKIPKGVE